MTRILRVYSDGKEKQDHREINPWPWAAVLGIWLYAAEWFVVIMVFGR